MPDVPILGSVQQSPVDLPLPTLVIAAHSFRVIAGAPGETRFRYTPVMPVGPGQWAPSSDHHYEVIFTVDSLTRHGGFLSQLAATMTPDQKSEAAAHFRAPLAAAPEPDA